MIDVIEVGRFYLCEETIINYLNLGRKVVRLVSIQKKVALSLYSLGNVSEKRQTIIKVCHLTLLAQGFFILFAQKLLKPINKLFISVKVK